MKLTSERYIAIRETEFGDEFMDHTSISWSEDATKHLAEKGNIESPIALGSCPIKRIVKIRLTEV